VFVTNDGGLTWDRRDLPIPPGVSPESEVTTFLDLLDSGAIVYVFVGADLVAALTSFDGGRSWSYTKPPASTGDRTGMSFVDSSHWWAVQRGGLYKTADAGQSWTHISEEPLGLHLIEVMDATHAWALLDEGYGAELASSADGGVHWTPMNVPVVSAVPSH
jgi:photosystem II stability/assembly factor-like uncharacterized protein